MQSTSYDYFTKHTFKYNDIPALLQKTNSKIKQNGRQKKQRNSGTNIKHNKTNVNGVNAPFKK